LISATSLRVTTHRPFPGETNRSISRTPSREVRQGSRAPERASTGDSCTAGPRQPGRERGAAVRQGRPRLRCYRRGEGRLLETRDDRILHTNHEAPGGRRVTGIGCGGRPSFGPCCGRADSLPGQARPQEWPSPGRRDYAIMAV
jgi:hypothetical protein